YRGFGVCRDIARINTLARARRERPLGFMPAPEADATPAKSAPDAAPRPERPAPSVAPAAGNVVPFRQVPVAEPKVPTPSPVEPKAFSEWAQDLNARWRGVPEAQAAAEPSGEGALAEAPQPQQEPVANAANDAAADDAPQQPATVIDPSLLDRLPIGVLVYRH